MTRSTSPARTRTCKALAGLLLTTSALAAASPAFAKGGVEGEAAPRAACTPIEVTNSGRTVKNRVTPPNVRFTITNCRGTAGDAVVTVTEDAGFFSTTCASPVAEPVSVSLAAGSRAALSVPAFRGPCGWYSQTSSVFLDSASAWQAHTLRLTVRDADSGTALGSSTYSWKDDKPGV